MGFTGAAVDDVDEGGDHALADSDSLGRQLSGDFADIELVEE